jgi:tetratricopeptide (TPR) repeat protein
MIKIKRNRPGVAGDSVLSVGSSEHMAGLANENFTWLVAGVAVAVISAVSVGGFIWYKQQTDRSAAEVLNEGIRSVTERPADAPPHRPEEIQKAIASFRKVLAEYPGSAAAPQAAYMLANALSDLRDWDGAIRAYQDFLSRYGDHRLLAPLVYQRLGYAYLSQGKTEDAEKAFSALLKMEWAMNKDQALYELAKIDETVKRPEGALARYQEIMKDYPQSPFAAEASVRVKTLDARKASQAPPVATPSAPNALPQK